MCLFMYVCVCVFTNFNQQILQFGLSCSTNKLIRSISLWFWHVELSFNVIQLIVVSHFVRIILEQYEQLISSYLLLMMLNLEIPDLSIGLKKNGHNRFLWKCFIVSIINSNNIYLVVCRFNLEWRSWNDFCFCLFVCWWEFVESINFNLIYCTSSL